MLENLEKTLPRASYLDPRAHESEMTAIFRPGWVCAGRSEQLPDAGSYQALRLGNESLLLVRDEAGNLRGFYNVCRHRGAELVAMPDTAMRYGQFSRTVTCPYHAWSYRFDGSLRGAPHIAVEPGATALHPIAVDEWGGFVFVRLDDRRGEPLLQALGAGTDRIANYPLADLRIGHSIDYRVCANWKVILENYNECYHCGPIHPELCDLVPAFRQQGGNNLNWDDGVPHREGAMTFTATGTTQRDPFPGLSDNEKTHHKGELFYPNLMLSLAMDHVAAFYVWPETVAETRVRCDFLFHPTAMEQDNFDPLDAVTFWDLVNRQDWQICESVQRGMQNSVFEHGYYAPMEDYSLDLRRYVADCLNDAG
ncbi:MAG: aromatic ring-hydroxylating dioxygenase subunit alpha [Luminiphilus sp.]|nr:aromatic ring-hydroxylating dioxygenase subunit alpha [Luminiphilus sp.]